MSILTNQPKRRSLRQNSYEKKLLLSALLLAVSVTAMAYEPTPVLTKDKWMGSVEFDMLEIPLQKGANTGFAIDLAATRKVHDIISLGGMVGLSEGWNFKGAPTFRIAARLHAEDFSKPSSPFFDFDLGYSVSLEDTDINGVVFNPTIGYRYGNFGVGFGYLGYAYDGSVASNLNLRLYYYFGYHKNPEFVKFIRNTDFGVALGVIFPGGNKGKNAFYYEDPSTGFALELSWLYNCSDNFKLGLFAGFNYVPETELYDGWEADDSASSFLFGVRGKYNFKQVTLPLGIYPYAKMDLGFASNVDTCDGTTSFYYSPGIGLSLPTKNGKQSIDLGLSYAPVSIEKPTNSWEEFEMNAHNVGSARLTLGYTF